MPEKKKPPIRKPAPKMKLCKYCGSKVLADECIRYMNRNGDMYDRCIKCMEGVQLHDCPECKVKFRMPYWDDMGTDLALYRWPKLRDFCHDCGIKHMDNVQPKLVAQCVECGEIFEHAENADKKHRNLCKECIDAYHLCECCENNYVFKGRVIIYHDLKLNEEIKTNTLCGFCEATTLRNCGICNKLMKGDKKFCPTCERDAIPCDMCGELVAPNTERIQNKVMCRNCRNQRAGMCTICKEKAIDVGRKYHHHHHDGNVNGCRECIGSPIMHYNYKPKPVFFGKGVLYYGIENEFDFRENNFRKMTDFLREYYKHDTLRYFAHDGSLNYGVEMIFNPMTFGYFETIPELIPPNILNNPGETAGCHVHMTKDAFTTFHLFKFLNFLTQYQMGMYPIYKRTVGRASPKNGKVYNKPLPYKNAVIAKQRTGDEKYWWINLKNKETIEIRLFKSASTTNELRAIIQSLDCLYYYTKDNSPATITFEGYMSALQCKRYEIAWETFQQAKGE